MNFYHSVLNNKFGHSAEQRGFRGGLSVNLFLEIKGRPVVVGTPSLSEAEADTYSALCRTLHGHELPSGEESDQVVTGSTIIHKMFTATPSSYTFDTNDKVGTVLGDMLTSCFYVWETRAICLVDRPDKPASVFSPAAQAMEMDQVDEKEGDVVEVATEVYLKDRKGAVLPFNPRSFEREGICLSIFQIQEVQNPLRAVSQKHEEDLLRSLKKNKYQYIVGLRTAANPTSGDYGTRDLEKLLADREGRRFLKSPFSLAVVDGRHRRSCILRLAESGEPGTEWASQPIRATLIKAPGSQVLTDHELFKLSWSANIRAGLILRDTSMIAILKSLIQYSKTFNSSSDVFFDEARIIDIAKGLVSCGLVQGPRESTYRRYVRVTRHFRRFPEALRLVEKVSEEAAEDESAGGKGELSTTHLDNALLFNSEEQGALHFLEAAAVYSKK